jgi:hypothetical protein
MKAVQRALALTLVATALCADRAMASPVSERPDATVAQGTLVGRLSVSLRRCVPAVRLLETRRDQDRPALAVVAIPRLPLIAPAAFSPFQFRMPPPLA